MTKGSRSPRPQSLEPALSRDTLQAALAAPRDFQSQLKQPPPLGGGCLGWFGFSGAGQPGRPLAIKAEIVKRIIAKTTQEK